MRAIASFLVVLTAVTSTAVAVLPTSSLAETWPQRNVRIITPFPAGTGADRSGSRCGPSRASRAGRGGRGAIDCHLERERVRITT